MTVITASSGFFRVHTADASPPLPVPSRASPPPPLPRLGSGACAAAYGSGGGSSPSRFSPLSDRFSHADTLPRWLIGSRGFQSLLPNDGGAATVTCM